MWVTFAREMGILSICFNILQWIRLPKYFVSLFVPLFPFIHVRSSCFEYKCP